jgi:hypothetical protein
LSAIGGASGAGTIPASEDTIDEPVVARPAPGPAAPAPRPGLPARRPGFEPPPGGPAAATASGGTAPASYEEAVGQVLVSARKGVDQAVGTMRRRIRGLEAEIKTLEADNAAKSREVDDLVRQIEDRKRELEDSNRLTTAVGVLGLFAGFFFPPALALSGVSAIKLFQDDARLDAMEARLQRARDEQRQVQDRVRSHADAKAGLEKKLGELRTVGRTLTAGLDAAPPPVSPDLAGIAKAKAQLDVRRKLLDNLKAQVATLEQIRDAALALGVKLDRSVETLRREAAAAEKLVEESSSSFLELIDIFASGNPAAAAAAWLTRAVGEKAARLVKELGLDLDGYVARIVLKAFPSGGAEADALKAGIVNVIREAMDNG